MINILKRLLARHQELKEKLNPPPKSNRWMIGDFHMDEESVTSLIMGENGKQVISIDIYASGDIYINDINTDGECDGLSFSTKDGRNTDGTMETNSLQWWMVPITIEQLWHAVKVSTGMDVVEVSTTNNDTGGTTVEVSTTNNDTGAK